MVEISPNKTPLKISVWRFVLVLLLLAIILLALFWYLFASRLGATNSFLEGIRKYLTFAATIHPNMKPEDNFADSLKIHGVEKVNSKSFTMLVSVTDKNGEPLTSINAGEIDLKVGGPKTTGLESVRIDKVTPLHMMNDWKEHVSFSSVMDYSASMFEGDLSAIENNFEKLMESITVPYAASIVKFNAKATEILKLSEAKDEIKKAIKKRVPLENTALFDGIIKGVEAVQARPHMRFLVLTTDGNDNASFNTLKEVLLRSKLHNVSIFVLAFGWLEVQTLRTLADETDGLYSYVPDSSKLEEWFTKLGKIINNVQVIEYSTKSDMEIPEKIDLTIKVNGKKLNRKR
jgi:hypothetical protein